MRLPLFALLSLALAGIGSAEAQTLKADYDISLAGIPLGTADLSSTFEGPKYKMQLGVKLTGIAKMLTGGKGAATASGNIAGAQPQPAAFAVTSRSSGDQRTVRMGLNAGTVAAVEIVPPIDEKPDRVPVKDADRKSIVDPISALLMPALVGGMTDSANCNRVIPVFDGAARFDIVLTYGETKQIDKPGYNGPVLVCNARYVAISGHRALRPSTKFMEDNKDMSVWLMPLEGTRLLVPVRIAVRTMVGMSVVEASNLSFGKDSNAPVQAGAIR
ncbi:DUF3108 domain-containing protein [Microvirga sp. 2MCAF38]|uniref:DUF3108 domain-containing protein n=1 Tax=Microvirga sp. 2MCAF38 TaxID=3232989 RepID=UPI003F97B4CF